MNLTVFVCSLVHHHLLYNIMEIEDTDEEHAPFEERRTG